MSEASTAIDAWLTQLHPRHVAPYRPQEFTRALRALSARYVERRSELPGRSPLDSAGKRAAFAAFYTPLHVLTALEIITAIGAVAHPAADIVDLGCGTGAGSIAWGLSSSSPVAIRGIDGNAWALGEARWNWSTIGLHGRADRGDLIVEAERRAATQTSLSTTVLIAAWSANELPNQGRDRLLAAFIGACERGASVLVIEPLAKTATPWWPEWSKAFAERGGRADEWKFRVPLPKMLSQLSQSAGFNRESLGARSLYWPPAK